ncbi:hypothetical protein I4J48_21400, partial [Pseudonocardia sp. KRD-169]|nr:hypothetical protein [Pseudonocardia abyssalis]
MYHVLLPGLLATVTARAVLAWAGEVAAPRACTDVIRQLRTRLMRHALAPGPRRPELPPTGELATPATRGLDGLEGHLGHYLPTLLVAAVVPAAVAGRILFADPPPPPCATTTSPTAPSSAPRSPAYATTRATKQPPPTPNSTPSSPCTTSNTARYPDLALDTSSDLVALRCHTGSAEADRATGVAPGGEGGPQPRSPARRTSRATRFTPHTRARSSSPATSGPGVAVTRNDSGRATTAYPARRSRRA